MSVSVDKWISYFREVDRKGIDAVENGLLTDSQAESIYEILRLSKIIEDIDLDCSFAKKSSHIEVIKEYMDEIDRICKEETFPKIIWQFEDELRANPVEGMEMKLNTVVSSFDNDIKTFIGAVNVEYGTCF